MAHQYLYFFAFQSKQFIKKRDKDHKKTQNWNSNYKNVTMISFKMRK
ncbi:hypothetical protein NT08PM_1666 [Pasteurella multocida subsp. multocida str. 3480]|nr:hypothetical protein NT08PM_1666 [Pasteurella multocida subsp. multocida str. 3480]